MKFSTRRKIFIIILFLCLSGCGSVESGIEDITSATITTEIIQPSPTVTVPRLTNTPRPTATITVSPTPTNTALPTLSSEDIISRVNQLFYSNGDCEYPCFWGFMPGVTTLQEVQYQLAPLIINSSIDVDKYYVSIPYSISNFSDMPLAFYFENNTIQSILIPYADSLPESLSTFGVPTNVWIEVQPSTERDILSIVLDYPQYGLYLRYEWYLYFQVGSVEQHDGVTSIQICPQDLQGDRVRSSFNETFLYSIENGYSFQDLWRIYTGLTTSDEDFRLQSIEETTYENVENFYNAFLIGGNQACFVIECDDCQAMREY